jgi:hypothetical protein
MQVSRVLRSVTDGYSFFCPGCEEMHAVSTHKVGGDNWLFDGNLERPTFSPSILVRSGHYAKGTDTAECWCSFETRFGRPTPFKCKQCHSFVRDGTIQFLTDSTHPLAGRTLPLPALPPEYRDD